MINFTFTSYRYLFLYMLSGCSNLPFCRPCLMGTQKTPYGHVVQVETMISSDWGQKLVCTPLFSSAIVQCNNTFFLNMAIFHNQFSGIKPQEEFQLCQRLNTLRQLCETLRMCYFSKHALHSSISTHLVSKQ